MKIKWYGIALIFVLTTQLFPIEQFISFLDQTQLTEELQNSDSSNTASSGAEETTDKHIEQHSYCEQIEISEKIVSGIIHHSEINFNKLTVEVKIQPPDANICA
jgi:hypothetical protein